MNHRRSLHVCWLLLLLVLGTVAPALAQQQFPNQFGQPGQGIPPEVIGIYLAFLIVVIVISLVVLSWRS